MALNFSRRPIFPPRSPDGGGEVFGRNHCVDSVGRDRGGVGNGGSCEPACTDIADLLPSDPFGMNLEPALTAAFACWIGDVTTNYSGNSGKKIGVYADFMASFNYVCGTPHFFPPGPGLPNPYSSDSMDEELPELMDFASQDGAFAAISDAKYGFFRADGSEEMQASGSSQYQEQVDYHNKRASHGSGLSTSGGSEEVQTAGFDLSEQEGSHIEECSTGGESMEGLPPHEALVFALRYLGIKDLLTVERVCKRLQYAVQTDTLLWRCIHISWPLSDRLTDDVLFELVRRADGKLRCLDLVECSQITDDGLKCIIESNPGITKLSVPGCVRLTMDGVVNTLKMYKSLSMPPMEYVRVGGISGAVTDMHYEELKLLVGMDRLQKAQVHKPRFFHNGYLSPSCVYDSTIDIESCPRCENVRLVYDCPAEGCQGKKSDPCRACKFCISRCVCCGTCITDDEYEETFLLDLLCLDCRMHSVHYDKPSEQQP